MDFVRKTRGKRETAHSHRREVVSVDSQKMTGFAALGSVRA